MEYRAIILADRSGAELAPLDKIACPALLEVAGKSVIEHTIEDLVEAGFREAVLVTSSIEAMRRQLGNGERWGIQLSYLLVKADTDPKDSLARLAGRRPVFVVRGDVLRGRFISRFLDTSLERKGGVTAGFSQGRSVGAWCGQRERLFERLSGADATGAEEIELGDIGLHALDCLSDFHAACLAAARGELSGVTFPGREAGTGIYAGRLAKVDGPEVREGELYAAEEARIGRGAGIRGTVVVGRGALVDRGATLENSVVMPGSYVGSGVELKHAIVAGSRLIRVDLGATAEVADDFLLASLDKPVWQPSMVSRVDRFVGLLLLLASVPLWPLALLASLFESPRRPLAWRRQISNRSRSERPVDFIEWRWQTRVPLLAHLPAVVAVVAGHLRLVGVRPPAPGEADAPREGNPAGMVGPALVDVEPGASEEECRLAEILFERRNTRLRQFAYLARAAKLFFSRRAWRGGERAGHAFDRPVSLGAPLSTDG